MTTTKHTPTPWHVAPATTVAIGIAHMQDGVFGKPYSSAAIVAPAPMCDKGWRYVAAINGKASDEFDADAAHIVACVNAHDALTARVAELEAALTDCRAAIHHAMHADCYTGDYAIDLASACTKARAALAKVTP